MKYSYLWLRELSKTKKYPKELAELLTMRAFEFENAKTEGKETQMEFSILPNRSHDVLSHIGMAREICALEGRKFPISDFRKFLISDIRNSLKVKIKDKKLCPRYIGAVLKNIKVGSSPKWIQERLLVCGVKPINNVVDITNYVMLETGQPMHAFDTEKTAGDIIIRRAGKGEEIRLLDEKTYRLKENNLVIADSQKALALAGVMGGFDSSITNKTTSIILESANFNSTNIRKTRTVHNIITESSHRFEREIDPNLAEIGMARSIELLQKYGGEDATLTDCVDVYPKKVKPWQIKLDKNYVSCLLGENIPDKKIKNILENLEIKTKSAGKYLNCKIPTFRIDLKSQEDLIEEIGRIYGYESIREQALIAELKIPPQNEKRNFENKLRDTLIGIGFSEMLNYSFYSEEDIEKCNLKIEDHVEVSNPLSIDQQYLRWSLAPNILKNVALNIKNFSEVKVFEIGNKFCREKSKTGEAAVLVGALAYKSAKEDLFFELNGQVESLLQKIGYTDISFERMSEDYIFWHESRTAEIKMEGKKIGRIGEVDPKVLRDYGIKSRVALFGIRLYELICKIGYPKEKIYKSISKFPSVHRDISMFVDDRIKYSDIENKIAKTGGKLLINVELFDIFEKESEKSLALRLEIGSCEKTLTSREIDDVMKKIITALEKDLKVKVRK